MVKLQYVFFCDEVITEYGDTGVESGLTFKNMYKSVNISRPGEYDLLLILGLRDIPQGEHTVSVMRFDANIKMGNNQINIPTCNLSFSTDTFLKEKYFEIDLKETPIGNTGDIEFNIRFDGKNIITIPLIVTKFSVQ